jgi:glycosyltransferase involved in cell wall biosynthesis
MQEKADKILAVYMGHHQRGCWKRLVRLLIGLADKGHLVKLLVTEIDNTLFHPNIEQQIVQPIQLFRRMTTQREIYFMLTCPFVALTEARKNNYKRLIAFDGHNAFCLILSKLYLKKSKLVLFVRSNVLVNEEFSHSNRSVLNYAIKIGDRIGHRFSDVVVYNSISTAKRITSLYGLSQEPIVIYNDIPAGQANYSTPESIRSSGRQELGLDKDDFVIGYCGQIIPRKNILYLIDMMDYLKRELSLKLVIKGDGYVYRLGLSEKIIFLPWSEDLASFYACLDLFVLPSVYEDSSNALLEALAHKVCVLASESSGNAEILNDRRLLFPLGKVHILANQVKAISENEAKFEEIREACRNVTCGFTFSWNEAMEKLIF